MATEDDGQPRSLSSLKIISGGQSGAELGALRAAACVGLATGGVMPPRFTNEHGANPSFRACYGVRESVHANLDDAFTECAKANIDAADATILFRFSPTPQLDYAITYAQEGAWRRGMPLGILAQRQSPVVNTRPDRVVTLVNGRQPVLVIVRAHTTDIAWLVNCIVNFVRDYDLRTLNVTGHRDSSAPCADFEAAVFTILSAAFSHLQRHPKSR